MAKKTLGRRIMVAAGGQPTAAVIDHGDPSLTHGGIQWLSDQISCDQRWSSGDSQWSTEEFRH